MYIIIGGDQKEYGPISTNDVRQWIAEGRLNEQSLMKAESDAEFRPLGKFPEFADAFAPKAALSGTPPPLAGAAGSAGAGIVSDGDYDLDIFGSVGNGWNLVKNNFGTVFLCLLVLVVICIALFVALGGIVSVIVPKHVMAMAGFKVIFNFIMSAVSGLVIGALAGGFYLVYLKLIRGLPTGVGDLFVGFQKSFTQLFLGYFAVSLVTGLCMAPFNYVQTARFAPLLEKMQNATPEQIQSISQEFMPAFASTLPILLICMIPLTYLAVNWLFTLPLIIDKQMDFLTAMKTSWRRVHRHWWQVFGLLVITGLLNIAGAFLCCIGLVFTVPVGIAALMFAYETIFSEGQAA
ncbi:MAG: glycerophosphoryl diester phosphodiesterase membrane domain-containing protein [Limisphaerales bacterium]